MTTQTGRIKSLPSADADGVILIDDAEQDTATFTSKTKGAKGLEVGDKVGFVNKDGKASLIKRVNKSKKSESSGKRDTSDRTKLHQTFGKAVIDIDIQNVSKRHLTAVFAFFLGGIGAHKFFLGLKKEGYIMLAAFFLGIFLFTIPTLLAILLAWVEGLKYLTMKDEDFNETYINGRKPWL
jgi:TM2 domain-containing membrane protein YozV